MSITTNAATKVAAAATGLAMAISMLGAAPLAHAQSAADLQAQISSLLATIQSLQAQLSATQGGSTGGSSYNFTRDLTIGSKGADVTALQNWLIAHGASIPAGATGYFGAQTQAALAKWQAAANVTPSVGYFGPKSRAALAAMGGGSSNPGTPIYGNGLKVMLSPTSPNGGALVQGQGIGDLADFVFSNPTSSAINVTSVTLNRTGVSNDSTLTNVYLYNGVNRITDSAGVNNSQFMFSNAAGLFTVPAGSSVTISVRSDILSTAAGQVIGVALVSVASTGTLDSSVQFPIAGGYMTVAAATLATVSFGATTLPSTGNISPQNDYPVWQNTVSVSTNPVWLRSMKFTNLGSIDSTSLLNLRLYVDGVQVGTAAPQLGSDRTVTFDLSASPLSLSTQSHVIKVLGNVVNGASRTFALSIQRSSDAMFVDAQLNQPVTPLNNNSTFSAITSGTVTINAVAAGSGVSVNKSSSSPVNDISVGATNVKLASFDMLPSGEDVKVSDLYVYVTTSAGNGINNGKIYLNGSQVGSTKDIGGASAEGTGNATDFSLGSSLILPAGVTSHVDIYGDAQTAAGANLSTGATILAGVKYVAANAQGQSSLISTAVPTTDTTGNTITVTSSALTATKYSGYANQTLLAGTTGALLGSFTLSAGSTEGLNVNTVEFDMTGSAGVTNLHLVDHATGSTLGLGSTISTPAATNNAFSTSFTLAANSTKTIDVIGDILSNASTNVIITLDNTTTSTGVSSGVGASLAGSSLTALQTITVGGGQLYAVRSASNPLSAIVTAGSSSVKTAVFSFSAVNSPFTVQKLLIKVPADGSTAVSSVMLSYKDANGATQTATQSLALSSGTLPYATATFTGLNFYVPNNSSSDLTVSVSTPTIANGGAAISGHAISAVLDYNEGFQAIDGSGSASTTPGFILADVNGANSNFGTEVVRKSIPTFAGQTSNLTTAPVASSDLFRFTVTADPAGPVDLYQLSFAVSTTSSGITAANWSIYDAADTSTALNVTAGNTNSSGNVVLVLNNTGAGYVAVPAGTTRTFVLRAATVSGWASAKSISTRFATVDASPAANAAAASVSGSPAYVWSDESANNHSTTSTDWTNGYLLKNLSDGVYSYSANF